MAAQPTQDSPAAVESPVQAEVWGSLKDILDGPLENVPWDASWLSVIGMLLFLLPTAIAGVVAGLCPKVFVCISVGTCCIPCSRQLCSTMGSVLSGRPLLKAWAMWRGMVATLVALIANGKSRLALFLWEWRAFGSGRYWWHGEGVWVGSYEDCDRILQGTQERKQAFGCVMAPVPDLYPSKLLIFLPNGGEDSEWAAIRGAIHQLFLDQGAESYTDRMQRLPGLVAGDWKSPKLSDLDDYQLVQRSVSKCLFFMMLGEWITDAEATTLGNWRGYAEEFILPRLVHRLKFNLGIKKVKALRQQTVGLVEKYGKQEVFVSLNEGLGRWKRSTAVQLCDEVMFAMGFAGIGGTCAATESVGAFLQVKLPAESPGKKQIHWGEYTTSEAMVAKYRLSPEKYIRETCRLDPPVTSATSALGEETKVTMAGREYTLPKGLLNQYALSVANRDTGLFPDEKVFNPDRENLEKALTWNGAFGAANEASYPRICPGRHLSLEVTRLLVDHALQPSGEVEVGV